MKELFCIWFVVVTASACVRIYEHVRYGFPEDRVRAVWKAKLEELELVQAVNQRWKQHDFNLEERTPSAQ